MKKAIIYITSMMLMLETMSFSNIVKAEDSNIEVVNFDYETKTESKETLSFNSYVNKIDESIDILGIDEESMDECYNPGLPTDNGISLNSIIGTDEQTRVNPNIFPYSAVLALYIGQDTNGDGSSDSWGYGTGFLEGNDVMATAGHCFWNATNGWIEECRIYTRQNSHTYGSTYYYPLNWTCATNYTENTDINYDWCAVTLQDNLGGSNGWFGKGCGGDMMNTTFTISGYPAASNSKRGFQYTASGQMTESTDYRVKYQIDTEGGNSGSPIYDSNCIVWGIHTHSGNGGSRITSWLYEILQNKYLEGVEKYKN